MTAFKGQCHCGAIGFTYTTSLPPAKWSVRACQCTFCRAHGAACTSDPAGQVTFAFADPAAVQRYRFGLHTADFLLCRRCGVFIAAAFEGPSGAYATLNTRCMASVRDSLPEPAPMDYGAEDATQRLDRRSEKWTPVAPPDRNPA